MTLRLFASALVARDYFPLLRWMIFTGVTVFGFAIAWRYGLFQLIWHRTIRASRRSSAFFMR
jgi:hypothetical protein